MASSGHLPGYRFKPPVTVRNVVRIDGRTYGWQWRSRRDRSSVIAIQSSEPFPEPLLISLWKPSPIRSMEKLVLGAGLTYLSDERLGRALDVASPRGDNAVLDRDRRYWPVILALVPTKMIKALPEDMRDRVPSGHEVVPLGTSAIVGAADGHWIVIFHSGAPAGRYRPELLALAERLRQWS